MSEATSIDSAPAAPSKSSPTFASKLKLLFTPGNDYVLMRWLFLRALGFIYLFAFLSLGVQITGLVGSHGILPVSSYLQVVKSGLGDQSYWQLPTLVWINSSDGFLQFLCFGGAFFAVLLVLDIAPVVMLILMWVFYLSLLLIGQDFLAFQWDILLLETGFLAIFFAPLHVLPRLSRQSKPPLLSVWLFRLLLFRLMFDSGVVKWASGDPTWHNFTALHYHYFTQPLPTTLAWFMYQLPMWFQQLSTIMTFVIEGFMPFLIFMPRRVRFVGAFFIFLLQALIFLTGNYTFFNLLTMVLCLTLLDDKVLQRLFPKEIVQKMQAAVRSPSLVRQIVTITVAVPIIFVGVVQTVSLLYESGFISFSPPTFASNFSDELSQYFIVNHYGLFAVMTTTRPEIIIEGSNDGKTWLPYEFKYKAGDLKRPPLQVAPYQPRLDWQLWFAALENYTRNGWFDNFMHRLLEGSPDVLALMGKNPFPDAPPQYVRATLYEYQFTDFATLSSTGDWWSRTLVGPYSPVISKSGDLGSSGLP